VLLGEGRRLERGFGGAFFGATLARLKVGQCLTGPRMPSAPLRGFASLGLDPDSHRPCRASERRFLEPP